MKILVADADHGLVDALSFCLKQHGYGVVRAFDGEQVMRRWRELWLDLVILDLQLPKFDCFEVWYQGYNTRSGAALLLTGSDHTKDEARWLEMGAEVYLHKPFTIRQLLAHITVVMHRSLRPYRASGSSMITVGPITLDTRRREVLQDGTTVRVTPTECRLLYLLMMHAGQALRMSMISKCLWGDAEAVHPDVIKAHICHLRQKIEPDATHPQYILTAQVKGYTFTASWTKEQ